MENIRIVILLLFSTAVMMAQQPELLSKEEAISETLEQNFGIRVAENNTEISENNSGILNSGFLPSLIGNAGATYNLEDQEATFQDGTVSTVDGAETTRYNASLNLNYTLSTAWAAGTITSD